MKLAKFSEKLWTVLDKFVKLVSFVLYAAVSVPVIIVKYLVEGIIIAVQAVVKYHRSLGQFRDAAGFAVKSEHVSVLNNYMHRNDIFLDGIKNDETKKYMDEVLIGDTIHYSRKVKKPLPVMLNADDIDDDKYKDYKYVTWTMWADGTITDEDNGVVEDYVSDEMIGIDNLLKFETMDDTVCYLVDEREKFVIELEKDEHNYKEESKCL